MSRDLIVRTKLIPPLLHRRILERPRVLNRLREALDYRLTIVQAGTGYGKSTALAGLAQTGMTLAWYHLEREDADPSVFLPRLFYSFREALPNLADTPLAVLEGFEGRTLDAGAAFVDVLLNALVEEGRTPVVLVLDDAHRLHEARGLLAVLDRLIAYAPARLHVILSTRYPPELPSLLAWRVKGEVLELGQAELAFTAEEIAALFREKYDQQLPPEVLEAILAKTEGWAIALQLLWQGLRSGAVTALPQALARLSGPDQQLFAYLAQEILEQQPAELRAFLRMTAVLRVMSAPICDCLRGANDSAQLLRVLLENNLLVVDLGDGQYRYHHLFREFLLQRLEKPEVQAYHRQAAACFRQNGDLEQAVEHLLAAAAYEEAATALDTLGYTLVRAGRLDMLLEWLNALPPALLELHPRLLAYWGDVARLRSRFNEALGWYRQAEQRARQLGDAGAVGQALRGQARVYLDTVNPSQAESILQEALRFSDGQGDREARANLLELLAENRLNLGRPEEAQALQAQARALREEGPDEAELAVRVMLRTGRLAQARQVLEQQVKNERQQPVQRPRAHRESLLLLSLILSLQGEGEAAYRYAVEGTERGRALHSPFVTAVGYIRQGHAWLLLNDPHSYDEACQGYREAIRWSEMLAVPRLQVEAYWGLTRAHGFQGLLDGAERAAAQGISLAEQAGDAWIAGLIRVSLGATYVLARKKDLATEWLAQALGTFHECADMYGQAVTRLWQCLLWLELTETARLKRGLEGFLELLQEQHYEMLLTRQTLLGPRDPRRVIPLLLYAREANIERAFTEQLLAQWGVAGLTLHPGFQLRVQTLGAFRVWRGLEEVPAQEWRRESARRLFQLLLTYRRQLLERDQILELLWPGQDPEIAVRDFKVALSTLFKVLEPERKANAPSAFILREGTLYGLRGEADVVLDVEHFERAVAAGDALWGRDAGAAVTQYQTALSLYQGEYLQEYPYAEWCSEERERLRGLYLRAAERVARALADRGAWAEVVEVCEAMLARDNCWEEAYRLLMTAQARLGNRSQALRTYQRCVEALLAELDVEPSEETRRVYASVVSEGADASW